MIIPKIVGIEQEYAIKLSGEAVSPFDASCMIINAYAQERGLKPPTAQVLWDYGHETPFRDIRGGLFGRRTGQQIIRDDENRLINTALPNGARLYTDHAHPEYSTPECLSAKDAVACDKAGEKILLQALAAAKRLSGGGKISLFKNNTDYQGHGYGCHENYLMDARTHHNCLIQNPEKAVNTLIPFLITRQIFAGAGKVGSENPKTRHALYQVSQRADFMEHLFGLETMYARPVINTRCEHHADETRFRRLHLIIGDANMSEWQAFLKIGSAQIVLQMIEADFLSEDCALKSPLEALFAVSSRFDALIETADGRRLNAADIQRIYLDSAVRFCQVDKLCTAPDADILLGNWSHALDGLDSLILSEEMEIEDDPYDLSSRLDWVIKLPLINRIRRSEKTGWQNPRLKVADLLYHSIDPQESIFYRLQDQGLAERIIDDSDIIHYTDHPPADTRAWFRGKCIEKFSKEMHLVNWEVVGFEHGDVYRMIPLLNPLKGTTDQFRHIFDQCRTSEELIGMLDRRNQ